MIFILAESNHLFDRFVPSSLKFEHLHFIVE